MLQEASDEEDIIGDANELLTCEKSSVSKKRIETDVCLIFMVGL